MKWAKSFTYMGKSSLDFNLVFANFDTSDDTLSLERELDVGAMNKYRNYTHVYSTKYTNTLTITFSVIKDPCKFTSQEELYFKQTEIDQIVSWLNNSYTPQKLHMDYYDTDTFINDTVNYYGIITNIEPIYNGNAIIGLTITFSSNSPFGWSDEKSITLTVNKDEYYAKQEFIVNTGSLPYVYPILQITGVANGDSESSVTITNESENNKELTVKVRNSYPYTIDCKEMRISDQLGIIWLKDILPSGYNDNFYWLRLSNGTNIIKVANPGKVQITWQEPKVGAF